MTSLLLLFPLPSVNTGGRFNENTTHAIIKIGGKAAQEEDCSPAVDAANAAPADAEDDGYNSQSHQHQQQCTKKFPPCIYLRNTLIVSRKQREERPFACALGLDHSEQPWLASRLPLAKRALVSRTFFPLPSSFLFWGVRTHPSVYAS